MTKNLKSKTPLHQGPSRDRLYPIRLPLKKTRVGFIKSASVLHVASTSGHLWHNRYGHLATNVLGRMTGSLKLSFKLLSFCRSCQLGKSRRLSFATSSHCETKPLELLFMDELGPFPNDREFHFYLLTINGYL